MSVVTTDPIADMLAQIKNAILVRKNTIALPYSKTKENLAKILKGSGFINNLSVTKESKKMLELLLFDESEASKISGLERVSKPGRRVYVNKNDIPKVLGGHGIAIVSTSQGLMTGKNATKKGLGGELICKVW